MHFADLIIINSLIIKTPRTELFLLCQIKSLIKYVITFYFFYIHLNTKAIMLCLSYFLHYFFYFLHFTMISSFFTEMK